MNLTENMCAPDAAKKLILRNALLKGQGELKSNLRSKIIEGLRPEQSKGGQNEPEDPSSDKLWSLYYHCKHTSKPPTLAVSINKENYTHEFIKEGRSLAVNVLDRDTGMVFIGRFGFKCGRDIDKFDGVKYHLSPLGNPILEENSTAFLEVRIDKEVDVGTHTIFIGEVVDADIQSDGEPLTYAHYHLVKKGKAPKTAPTYIEE
jgi:hypothetical protein